jgi:uncharacterized protein involved in exopolysaccharide biosynthesis
VSTPIDEHVSRPVTVQEAIDFLRRYGRWLLTSVLLGGAAALALALFSDRVYRARVVVVPVTQDAGAGVLARLAGQLGPLGGLIGNIGLGGGENRKEVALATLRSRELLRTFIERDGLMPVLFADRWDAPSKSWSTAPEDVPSIEDAVLLLEKRVINVSEDRRTGLITVAVKWTDRELAARWANRLVTLANELVRDRVLEENERSVAYLEGQLASTDVVERKQIIYRLIESRTSEIMLANGRPEYAFAIVDPATPPDADRFVSPRIVRSTIVGMMLGGLAGLFGSVCLAAKLGAENRRPAHAKP